MKTLFPALALLALAAPATAQKVEVAEGDWSNVPRLRFVDMEAIRPNVVDSIQRLVTSGQCALEGVSKRRVDMTVPFLVRFAPNGTIQHVVLRRLGCPEAEGILAGAILGLLKAGTFQSTGENRTGWYRSELSFSYS